MVLKEGPGAGYTITVDNYEVKSIDVLSIDSIELAGTSVVDGLIIKGKCNGKVIANGLEATSYMYSTEKLDDIPAEFSWFEFEDNSYYPEELIIPDRLEEVKDRLRNELDLEPDEDIEINDYSYSELFNVLTTDVIDTNAVAEALSNAFEHSSSSMVYGGGYLHCTYDGQLVENDGSSFNDENLICDLYISPNEYNQWCTPIEYIDKAVTGDNESTTYDVINGADGDLIDSKDEMEEAIECAIDYAETENISISNLYVSKSYWIEYYDGTVDLIDSEIVWDSNDYQD